MPGQSDCCSMQVVKRSLTTPGPPVHDNAVTIDKLSTGDARDTRAEQAAIHTRISRLSRLMDTAIPLPGGYRIGWDGIIGLIPGVGDIAGMLVSLYIVAGARRTGASGATLIRMLLNVAIEVLIGSLPIVGDLFDLAFKANTRNMQILNRQLDEPAVVSRQSQKHVWIVGLLAIGLFMLAAYIIVRVIIGFFAWLF